MDEDPLHTATELLAACRKARLRIVTAESCTGGLVAAALTEIAGSSDVMDRGFVTYSNEAKIELLDVPSLLIERYGAVSEEVARAMASGALARSLADLSVSVTGIAGPGGGTSEKPVGLVHFAATRHGLREALHQRHVFAGDRHAIRQASVATALSMLNSLVTKSG